MTNNVLSWHDCCAIQSLRNRGRWPGLVTAQAMRVGWAPLASLAPLRMNKQGGLRSLRSLRRCRAAAGCFCERQKQKKMLLDVDRVDSQSNSQTSILGSRAVYLLTSVTRICHHGMIVVPSNRYEILPSNGICDD